MSEGIIVAIISGIAGILSAIIAGVFSMMKRKKGTKNITNIKQKQGIANKGTQVGIQNNINNNNSH